LKLKVLFSSLVVGALLFSTAFALPVLSAAYSLNISLNGSNFSPGSTVVVSGQFLADGQPTYGTAVTLQVNGPDGNIVYVNQAFTARDGTFQIEYVLPADAPSGTYQVTCAAMNTTAQAAFTVGGTSTPTPTPSPTPTPTPSSTPTPSPSPSPTPTATPSTTPTSTPQPPFPDLLGHWAREQVEKLVEMGIINGYPDGLFRPDSKITRAEFTKIIVSALHLELQASPSPTFLDVGEDHWALKYIEAAAERGIVKGIGEGKFAPERNITRAEMATMIARALGLSPEEGNIPFTDAVDIPEYARGYVFAVSAKGIITGYPDGTFRPYNDATRAEAATMIFRMLSLAS